jgi:hypothetical protein
VIKILYFLPILVIACNPISGQITYYDDNDSVITKHEFNKKENSLLYFSIPGDSLNQKKLIYRYQEGEIKNKSLLIAFLKQELKFDIDTTKLLIIIYYPGKDLCNSGVTKDKNLLQSIYHKMEYDLQKLAGVKALYLYKDKSGLEKYEGILNWLQDPEHIVEKIFFKYHYPCESFVVISKNGKFKSYLGEFPKEMILDFAEQLLKQD